MQRSRNIRRGHSPDLSDAHALSFAVDMSALARRSPRDERRDHEGRTAWTGGSVMMRLVRVSVFAGPSAADAIAPPASALARRIYNNRTSRRNGARAGPDQGVPHVPRRTAAR